MSKERTAKDYIDKQLDHDLYGVWVSLLHMRSSPLAKQDKVFLQKVAAVLTAYDDLRGYTCSREERDGDH